MGDTMAALAKEARQAGFEAKQPVLADGLPIARPPQQGRSRASLERMLDAAEALLIRCGNDDFALLEVSRVGRVSIGSIYNRFSSKDELIQAVHARVMERIEVDQLKITVRARSRSTTPVALVRALLDDIGDFLRANAPILRPMMMRAVEDQVVQRRGREAHDRMLESVSAEMLTQRRFMRHPDPERAVRAVIRIAYAAFARELGFGMPEIVEDRAQWTQIKEEVGGMGAAYLFCTIDLVDEQLATQSSIRA